MYSKHVLEFRIAMIDMVVEGDIYIYECDLYAVVFSLGKHGELFGGVKSCFFPCM